MNSNDVFPILDLIRRERQKVPPEFRDISGNIVETSDAHAAITDWRVTSLDISRDTGNPVNPRAIKLIDIKYDVGATAQVELIRGAEPPVVNFGRDTDYLNHVMLRQVRMTTQFGDLEEIMLLTIRKSADYTAIEGVDVEYIGRINTITLTHEDGEPHEHYPDGELYDPNEELDEEPYIYEPYQPPEQNLDEFYNLNTEPIDEVIE